MPRLLKKIAIALLCAAICCPIAEAQGRGRNGGTTTEQRRNNTNASRNNSNSSKPSNSSSSKRPGNNGNGNQNTQSMRPSGNNSRPGNNGNVNQGNNNKPNNSQGNKPNNNQGNNPGNNNPGNNNFGPGNNNHGNNPGNYNPGHNNPGHNNFGPGNNPGPGNDYGHGPSYAHKPGHQPAHWGNLHYGIPYRPYMPPPRPYSRPVPPAAWIPGSTGSFFSTILGVALGTAINLSINSLINSGYTISGYNNDAVYISNAMQLNLFWPNATLYYNNGYLTGSEFVQSTPYYDMSQYNTAYNRLVNAYGFPIATNPINGGGTQCTWWGGNGQYVTLQFQPAYANNGTLRYYTTLAFGN